MALWGKSTTAESRPKFLPEDSNAAGSSGAREHAIVQPGGSIRDQEVIDAANRLGISMLFTGHRLFRH